MKSDDAPPNPQEWDYRGVGERDLATALCYEVARYCPRFRDAIVCWHAAPFEGFSDQQSRQCDLKDPNALPKPGSPNKDVVRFAGALKGDPAKKIRQILRLSLPHEFQGKHEFQDLALEFDRFPEPWMSLPQAYRQERIKNPKPIKWGSIVELPYKMPPEEGDDALQQLMGMAPATPLTDPLQSHVIILDWSLSDKILLSRLREWLTSRRPRQYRGKHYTGKGAAPPFHCLKLLAAHHLIAQCKNATKARSVVAKRVEESSREDQYDVLPNFSGSGAWSKAVAHAAKLLHIENPFWEISLRCHHIPRP
jgi:hypothetical protein